MDIHQFTTDETEHVANVGKDLTLKFLSDNKFITKEVAEELQKTLFCVAKKKSWFSSIFGKDNDPPVFRLAKLTEVPKKAELEKKEDEK